MRICTFQLLGIILAGVSRIRADEPIEMRELLRPGETSVVTLEFKVDGNLLIPEANNKESAQQFTAHGRLSYEEKILPVAENIIRKSLRFYTASSLDSTVEKNRTVRELREPMRLMVCEIRRGRPFLFSPSGPLTIDEYELVEADATLDSLSVGDLLPPDPVAAGEQWQINSSAVAAIFSFARVTENAITAKLESYNESSAKVTLAGHVSGIASGAQTTRSIAGQLLFDRTRSKIVQIDWSHSEEREIGPLSHALRAKANYTYRRDCAAKIVHLNDDRLAELPVVSNPATEQLLFVQPDRKFFLYLQRDWFVTLSHPQATVLRLVENGQFISECHVLAAPTVAAGTHMKPEEFRAQVQQALGSRFQQFVQQGEVPAPKGYWIYRLAAAGSAGRQAVMWNYYLVAGPQGQQLVFIFRVPVELMDDFGVKDLALVSTIEFDVPRTASSQK